MDKKKMGFIFPAFAAMAVSCSDTGQPQKPNILLIVADDLGMGDVNAYAPYDCAAPGRETISTPNIDSLAHGGILFLNGYSTSATSTPSRYAMFTGMYPWKNPQAKILNGDAPLLIPVDIPTLPKMLQAEGYTTGAIGKWHLGMGDGDTDWNRHISPDANTVGFDYTCLIAATNDRVPTVYVENGLVENLDPSDPIQISYSGNFSGEPTAVTNPELVKMRHDPRQGHDNTIVNGIPRIGFMKGGHKARWVDEEMADYFAAKTRKFIDSCSVSGEPFFLYYGLHEPHVPRAPHPRFAGSTGLGPRGDAVAEADWCVGEIIRYLSVKGLLENILVIFTSDNGPVINDGYLDGAEEMLGDHDPRNGTRGGKYSLYDGGTHIPLIVYWKGHLKPMVSDAFVSQLDFFASIGSLTGGRVPEGIDSQDHLDVFLGQSRHGRQSMVLEAGGRLAYKSGDYELIPPYKGEERNVTGNEMGNLGSYGLFNLKEDPAQEHNLAVSEPEKLQELKDEFKAAAGKYYKGQ